MEVVAMPTTANLLDLSVLPAAARREVKDFYQFLLARGKSPKKISAAMSGKQRFADLCGTLTWQGDAVAAQRRIRDEW